MATGSNVLARNAMLQAILDWNPGSSGTGINIGAFSADADAALEANTAATYSTPATSAMDITANVVINISAGITINHLRIYKDAGAGSYVYKKDITAEVFTFAGTITITSAEISIADA